jgi:predicted AAA+ superfamily ATPase
MYIPRNILATIKDKTERSDKIVVLYGARQVGKTTLVRHLLEAIPQRTLFVNGDELKYANVLSSRDLNVLRGLVSGYELLVIDEAQRIPNIGINLKILHDNMPGLKIIATGSSSFELANRIAEPLTGRTWTYTLYPIAVCELEHLFNPFELNSKIEEVLVFGSYPELFSLENVEDKAQYLREVCGSYLYRDILALSGIRKREKIVDLLRLLAYQIGSQVSLEELSRKLSMSKDTVSSYIDLLEKSFVIFRLHGFSRNLRKEVVKMKKIYFCDLGIRNTLIDNMKRLNLRDDTGKLWENFLIIERQKTLSYGNKHVNPYFWRTYTGAELDYVEESGGTLAGFEFTYSKKKKKAPDTWREVYPKSSWQLIHSGNYRDFLLQS